MATTKYTIGTMNDVPLNIEVRQIYIWLKTLDNKYILVSKNGTKYQQPGGHPELGESIKQTILREVIEETGISLQPINLEQLKFIGYYTITEDTTYLQLRFFLQLDKNSFEYNLQPIEKDSEKPEDRINFVKAFTLEEAYSVIPWLKESDELKSLIEIAHH